MKKLLFILLVLPLLLSAQDDTSESLKAQGGERTLELQLSPLGNTPIGISGIRVRWFKSESKAVRLNFFAGLDSDTQIIQQEDAGTGDKELKEKTAEWIVSLRPGFERHIHASDRLSPYFGMEFELTYQHFSEKRDQQDGNDVNYIKFINPNRTGFFRLGANAIAGMDYYVSKKLYLGTEFGFGFSYTSFLKQRVKSDFTGFVEPEAEKQGSAIDIGPNVLAQIRLGYAF